jgi:hypothetical protein
MVLSPAGARGQALDPGLPLHYSSAGEAVKVIWLAWILGTVSGLRFVAPGLPPDVMIVTAVAMHITHAIICRIFALQSGRDGRTWMIAGFVVGVVATTALLVANALDTTRPAEPPH